MEIKTADAFGIPVESKSGDSKDGDEISCEDGDETGGEDGDDTSSRSVSQFQRGSSAATPKAARNSSW